MFQPIDESADSFLTRLRERFGRRAVGIALTLLFEVLLALLVLAIGRTSLEREVEVVPVVTFQTSAVPAPEAETPESDRENPQSNAPSQPRPQPQRQPPQQRPVRPTPPLTRTPLVEISPNRMAETDIANLPSRPAAPSSRGPIGPPGTGARSGDSERVGTAPNGQPMYGASWYPEPTDSQMRGYMSTADGPGYALIACRTVPNYRVEDCVELSEYPRGSNIGRAALAAAWQFRIRPPWVGGQSLVGSWVRITIEYDIIRR